MELLLRLPVTPNPEDAFPDPEKAQTVEEEAQNTEIPQEYRVAHRESNADNDHACNNAFHKFIKVYRSKKAVLMPVTFFESLAV